jgi:hypothetical protein
VPSGALVGILEGLTEVVALQRVNPTPTGSAPALPKTTSAVGRASVVLSSSHLERYLRAVNEEVCEFINEHRIPGEHLPLRLRLRHSQRTVDDLALIQWERRGDHLSSLVSSEAWLWGTGTGSLVHGPLLAWMKSPKPVEIARYYSLWEIEDIFCAITRTTHNRSFLWLKLEELVEKRNNIAHGDFGEQATQGDITEYRRAIRVFCTRADAALARQVARLFAIPRPW